jgi:hypothetical protein
MAEAEQMERPADGAGVDRLPEPIQYEHGMFEHGIHTFPKPTARKLAKPFGGATQKVAKSFHPRAVNAFAAGAREPSVSSEEFSAQRGGTCRSESPRQVFRA